MWQKMSYSINSTEIWITTVNCDKYCKIQLTSKKFALPLYWQVYYQAKNDAVVVPTRYSYCSKNNATSLLWTCHHLCISRSRHVFFKQNALWLAHYTPLPCTCSSQTTLITTETSKTRNSTVPFIVTRHSANVRIHYEKSALLNERRQWAIVLRADLQRNCSRIERKLLFLFRAKIRDFNLCDGERNTTRSYDMCGAN